MLETEQIAQHFIGFKLGYHKMRGHIENWLAFDYILIVKIIIGAFPHVCISQ